MSINKADLRLILLLFCYSLGMDLDRKIISKYSLQGLRLNKLKNYNDNVYGNSNVLAVI